jgi:FlaA1/EpsC-like NDP-sugar epimerase
LREQVVMVTGAAGSIGAALCRQIAASHASTLVGFDQAETPLFFLQRELAKSHPALRFQPVVGNVARFEDLNRTMEIHKPAILYHAAAYKHVALMESQPFAAVENNVFGTVEIARVAIAHDVESVVLISTDKAVRPASIMGASKRIAELVLLALAKKAGTRFVTVRFGNVIESSGSVIPIFREQIAAGGPVTVTDAAMKRYFMTVAEAAELVLQAPVLGQGGEIFVFDMGQPKAIVDLAKELIQAAGYEPDREIRIEFVGMRPGEKLIEDLHRSTERLVPTAHNKIRSVLSDEPVVVAAIESGLLALRRALNAGDKAGLIVAIKELVPDYGSGPLPFSN